MELLIKAAKLIPENATTIKEIAGIMCGNGEISFIEREFIFNLLAQ